MTVKTRDARRGEDYERLLCQERLILDVTEAVGRSAESRGHNESGTGGASWSNVRFRVSGAWRGKESHAQDHCGYLGGAVGSSVV